MTYETVRSIEDVIAAEAVDWLNRYPALDGAGRRQLLNWVCRSDRHYMAFLYLHILTGGVEEAFFDEAYEVLRAMPSGGKAVTH